MGRTQYYCAATLDGYIADPDDGLGWLFGYEGTYDGEGAEPPPMSEGGAYERFYDGVVLDHMGEGDDWPYAGKPYWVLSSRDLPTPPDEQADVRIANAQVADLHEEMMAAAGDRNLWVIGGGNVASQYVDAGLLDELLLTVVPVVLGEGKPLFDRPLPGGPMQLTGTRTFQSGMVELRYEITP